MIDLGKNKNNLPLWRQRIRRALLVMSFIMYPVTFAYLSCPIITDGASQGIITGGLIVFGLIFFASLVVGRMWCGYLCPAGSLQEMIYTRVNDRNVRIGKLNGLKYLTFLGRKIRNLIRWPALHLEAEPGRCVDCKKCSQECPMSLT